MAPKPTRSVDKLDLRKRYRELYSPSATRVQVVDVPDLLFTSIHGVIEPGVGPSDSDAFRQTMEAMYAVAYGLKFMSKLRKDNPIDFSVMAVEGLWSIEPGRPFDPAELRDYTLLMLQPDHITRDMLQTVVSEAAAKRPNPALHEVTLERWREGPCIQIMHLGPYADEPRTLEVMESFAAENGFRLHGRHHEIYLGDPRRSAPEKLKTVLRHPIES